MNHRQGQLALLQVRPHFLAEGGGICGVIQQVVSHLESDAQMITVFGQPVQLICRRPGQQGPRPAGATKKHRRFSVNYRHVFCLAQGHITLAGQLVDLSQRHLFGDLADYPHQLYNLSVGRDGQGPR